MRKDHEIRIIRFRNLPEKCSRARSTEGHYRSLGRPDYFGQTVNIAARVQALAEGDELVLTEAAWRAPNVSEQLTSRKLTATVSDAALKGVAEKVKVHTIAMMPAR